MSAAIPDTAPLCAPPDRNPRPPRTKFPPLACDTHAHIFEARFPYSNERIYTPPDSNLADYVRTMRRLRELPVRVVHAGHDPSFGRDRLIELADAYLARRDPGYRAAS